MGTMTTSNEGHRLLETLTRSVQLRPGRYREALAQARALREAIRQEYGVLPDSVEDIRAMREERDTELAGLDSPPDTPHQIQAIAARTVKQ